MEIEMGDCIITTVDKVLDWGDEKIFFPKGTIGLTCEVYEKGAILAEVGDNVSKPWIFGTFYAGEYEKWEKKK